ncbi:MAG: hypothetical protein MUF81_19695 [Verrucomicrobia bacterium]|jgi:hypothetical protein|nr:hypothetical protein [Verrucomicrobiota bacterium]
MSTKAKAPDGLEEFKRKHPEFWAKLEKDKALTRGLKKKFAKHLATHKKGDISEHAVSFFRANKLKGAAILLNRDEVLGSVRAKTALVARLRVCAKISRIKTLRHLADWVGFDVNKLQSEIENLLGDALIGQFVMWSYRNERDAYDPFSGVVVRDLPCRLGLPSFPKEDHYAFGHMMPDSKARRVRTPTAFDGELYQQWIPGGFTRPHDACKSTYSDGLPEVVHRPNNFKNIYTKLKEIQK